MKKQLLMLAFAIMGLTSLAEAEVMKYAGNNYAVDKISETESKGSVNGEMSATEQTNYVGSIGLAQYLYKIEKVPSGAKLTGNFVGHLNNYEVCGATEPTDKTTGYDVCAVFELGAEESKNYAGIKYYLQNIQAGTLQPENFVGYLDNYSGADTSLMGADRVGVFKK